jgi:hypothetical protein
MLRLLAPTVEACTLYDTLQATSGGAVSQPMRSLQGRGGGGGPPRDGEGEEEGGRREEAAAHLFPC